MYDLIQDALTVTAEFIAVAGLTGIIAHAFYTHHKQWMAEHCPPVAPCQSATEPEVKAVVTPVAPPEAPQPPEVESVEILFQQVEQVMSNPIYQESEPELEIDLDSLEPATLRKLCSKHSIAWKNVRGKNRHATKAMMVHQLQQLAA